MLLVLKKIIGPLTINNNIITWHLRFCKIDTSTLMLNVKNRVKNIATLQTAFLFFLLQSVILFFMSDLFTYLTDLTVVVAVTRHRDQRGKAKIAHVFSYSVVDVSETLLAS